MISLNSFETFLNKKTKGNLGDHLRTNKSMQGVNWFFTLPYLLSYLCDRMWY